MRKHSWRRHWTLGLRWWRALVVHPRRGSVRVVWEPPLLLLWRRQLNEVLRLEGPRARHGGVGLGLEGPRARRGCVWVRLKSPGARCGGIDVVLWRLGGHSVGREGRVRGAEQRGQSRRLGTGQRAHRGDGGGRAVVQSRTLQGVALFNRPEGSILWRRLVSQGNFSGVFPTSLLRIKVSTCLLLLRG